MFWEKKTNCKSFREVRFHHFSSLSDTVYHEKNPSPCPTSSSSQLSTTQTAPTWSTSTDDIPRTSQSTSKTAYYSHSWTHDDGPPPRAGRLETGAGVWRRRGALGCLGCSLPLLACPGKNACSYIHTSVTLTCPSATAGSSSTGISIPARQQQQHGSLRLPRSMFRGLLF